MQRDDTASLQSDHQRYAADFLVCTQSHDAHPCSDTDAWRTGLCPHEAQQPHLNPPKPIA